MKELGYGKNWLLLLNRLIWIIARKKTKKQNSITYNCHRNGIAKMFTEQTEVCGGVGWLS